MIKNSFLFLLCLMSQLLVVAQDGGYRTKKLLITKAKRIDTCSIYPNSFEVYVNDTVLPDNMYSLDYSSALFTPTQKIKDTLSFAYHVFPFDLSKTYKLRDSAKIFDQTDDKSALFKIENIYSVDDVFGGNDLNKNGSISRGVINFLSWREQS